MLDQERKYFCEHLDQLRTDYRGKFVVIKGDEFVGAFDTIEDALSEGGRQFGLQSFLVRRVEDGEPHEVSVPALTLGVLSADPPRSIRS